MVRVFTSHRCVSHAPPPGFPERPDRLDGILDHLAGGDWEVEEVASHAAARERVTATHDPEYVARFERAAARGDGLLDSADNPLSPGIGEAAWAAMEVSLAAADWVMAGERRRAFAAVRPPGHHAERAMAMGFCYFNNVAVAAEHLLAHHGCSRLAIFDFDVHHGNGTQHIFEERADVLYASTHQYPFYPGTGAASERGMGEGEGFTVNVPLAAGTGDEGYAEALEGTILPALESLRPEVLLLSAGFDAWRNDPLGGMEVSEEAFERWGRQLAALADRVCDGRVLALLEGGYDVATLPRLVEVHLRGLDTAAGAPGD